MSDDEDDRHRGVSEDFDDRDLPADDMDRPQRKFDLAEEDATTIAQHVAGLSGTFDVNRCVGGPRSGDTDNAWAVTFGFQLAEGYHVRAEIHQTDQYDGEALNEPVDTVETVKDNVLSALDPVSDSGDNP